MSGSTICKSNSECCQLQPFVASMNSETSQKRLCMETLKKKSDSILTIAGYDGYPLHLAQTRSSGASSVSLSKDRSVDFPVNRIFQ